MIKNSGLNIEPIALSHSTLVDRPLKQMEIDLGIRHSTDLARFSDYLSVP